MRALWPILVLLAACGDERAAGEWRLAAKGVTRLVVVTGDAGVELVTAAGDELVLLGDREPVTAVVRSRLKVSYDGARPLRVTAPTGLDLVVRVTGRAQVSIAGKWADVTVTAANGDVAVDLDETGAAKITAAKGSILFACSEPPRGSVTATSTRGAQVTLKISSRFRGVLNLATRTGKILVPKHHPRLSVVNASTQSVLAFLGKPFTVAEHKQSPVDRRPGIWGSAHAGNVTLELVD